ncbi:hypothetical protein ABZ876_35900 [Streptomyces sp. NPDC046931]|uniref:hypothetical protein n=1 Tax=Streptomyces sp. NPDC046931 TaxID=3154806 RepID=UPI0034050997
MVFDEPGQTLIQLLDLPGELLDALGQQAQVDAGGLAHGVLVAFAIAREAHAGAEQLAVAQTGQPLPQGRVGDDQDSFELIDRLGASLDRGVLGKFEHPGAAGSCALNWRPPSTSTDCAMPGPTSRRRPEVG